MVSLTGNLQLGRFDPPVSLQDRLHQEIETSACEQRALIDASDEQAQASIVKIW